MGTLSALHRFSAGQHCGVLETGNAKLKKLLAEAMLDNATLVAITDTSPPSLAMVRELGIISDPSAILFPTTAPRPMQLYGDVPPVSSDMSVKGDYHAGRHECLHRCAHTSAELLARRGRTHQ
jgi:hypothetical protein